MATYTLINKTVLASATETVTFSSIPATYTDLLLKASIRMNSGTVTATFGLRFNNVSTGSEYSTTGTYYDGTSGTTFSYANDNFVRNQVQGGGSGATTGAFSFHEFYIANYAGSLNKQIEGNNAIENNGVAHLGQIEGQWRNTAINSVSFFGNGNNFGADSSFYIYGISNA